MKRILITIAFSIAITCFLNAQVSPETALKSYLQKADNHFKWEVKETYAFGDVTAYGVLLTSQQWREHIWKHELTILVPKEVTYDGALLYINGGSVKEGEPNWNGEKDKFNRSVSILAAKNKAIVAVLRQTPNQPLYNGLYEDALISMTLHNFKQDGDYTWPLLFPMVKSAVKAMDAVQEFSKQHVQKPVSRFLISGASKRGWTTWLTGAMDSRAEAIAPMVIDILNMPVSLDYQIKALGGYSEQIDDYVKLGIPQEAKTESGAAVTTMIDPYSYRANLTQPKMIFMGTNDEYWVVDNVKNYLNDIPGQNLLHYVPNAGHNLGGGMQALQALSGFWGSILQGKQLVTCGWSTKVKKGKVELSIEASPENLEDVIVWEATGNTTDFRKQSWSASNKGISKKKNFKVSVNLPSTGYKAFYVDLKYRDVNGDLYTTSTRVFMTDVKTVL